MSLSLAAAAERLALVEPPAQAAAEVAPVATLLHGTMSHLAVGGLRYLR